MDIIVRGARQGKTTELIKIAAERRSYMVVPSRYEAYRVAEMAKEMGLTIFFPLTYNEFLGRRYYGRNISGFVIDNVDMLLRTIVHGGASVEAISLTGNLLNAATDTLPQGDE